MRRILPLLAALSAAGLVSPAKAQSTGGYAGIGLMSVSTDNAREFAAAFIGPGGSADGSADGLKIYGGYLWPNHFGVEAGYYDLGSYEVSMSGTPSDEFEVGAFAVSGVYAVPMGANFALNLKLGLAFTNVDYSCLAGCGSPPFVNTGKSGTSGLLGAGVGWKIAPSFSLRADFEYFGAVVHSVGGLEAEYGYSAFSFSGQFRF